MNSVNCRGVEDQGSGDENFGENRENADLAALEALSLDELGTIASREISESNQLQIDGVNFSRRSTIKLYRAGRMLWCARKKLKGKGKRVWTKWQKANGIPTTSAWQAIRLYEAAESEEVVAGLTRSQALKKYEITKPRKKSKSQQAPELPPATEIPVVRTEAPVNNVGETKSAVPTPDLRLITGKPDHDKKPQVKTSISTSHTDVAEDPTANSTMPQPSETLVLIVRRLELLEQDSQGIAPSAEVLTLIDQAIVTLRRMRGDTIEPA